MIYWSHVKCMTTDPGVLEKDYEELDLSKMSPTMVNTVFAVKDELKRATLDGEDKVEQVEMPVIDPAAIKENLEESKETWFNKLFGVPSKALDSLNVDSDLKVIREQRKRALEANDKKMKYENMVVVLSKFKMDSLKQRPSESKTDVSMHAQNIRFLSNLLTKSCRKCHSLKPPASHHCSICGYCIARMDHHCPWVNNCVGINNQKFFLQFLIYVFLGSFHALVLIVLRGFWCLDKDCALFQRTSTMVIAGLSAFLALLFGLFVIIMFVD